MFRGAILSLLSACLLLVFEAKGQIVMSSDLDSVVVYAPRKMTDIGSQKSVLDTLALRSSISNSLADVLSQNSSVFIKSYGRATVSTASFRGTAPSHTQVLWNGMKLNSPMLGMVDFSMIPSYFIDDATLYHGASSVEVAGGAMGGAVVLATSPVRERGFTARYIQGVSSYSTFDQFLRLAYASKRWQLSTRAYYATSQNDFSYINRNKKDYIIDESGDIIGYTRPKERNKSGDFKDLHILQEFYYSGDRGSRWGVSAWYINSHRGVPMINVIYKDEDQSRAAQDEQTIRVATSWERMFGRVKLSARAGYSYTDMMYVAKESVGDELRSKINSQSYVHNVFAEFSGDYYINDKWIISANLSATQSAVKSLNDSDLERNDTIVGYNEARVEMSLLGSVRYKPTSRLGLALSLREELYGDSFTPLIPALFVEYTLSRQGSVILKASVARNYRYPTLNDLYFMPGGNRSLKPEKGVTYDGGVEFTLKNRWLDFKGEATVFDSHIRDWIVWVPTFKGFWTPQNVRKVHSYGVELRAKVGAKLGENWRLTLDANYTITNAINRGDPSNWADQSIGKQLIYIPKYSSAVSGRLEWRNWALAYRWNYYSERYATSSNETKTKVWRLQPYYMNDVSIERSFRFKWADMSFKFAVNNLFDEAYESVLSRPMPGRNFGLFVEIVPKFKRR